MRGKSRGARRINFHDTKDEVGKLHKVMDIKPSSSHQVEQERSRDQGNKTRLRRRKQNLPAGVDHSRTPRHVRPSARAGSVPSFMRAIRYAVFSSLMLVALSTVLFPPLASAQVSQGDATHLDVASETNRIQSLIDDLVNREELDESARGLATQLFQDALSALQLAADNAREDQANESSAAAAAPSLRSSRATLNNLATDANPNLARGLDRESVENLIDNKRTALADEREALEELENSRSTRTRRRKEIPVRLADLDQLIEDVENESSATGEPGEPQVVLLARSELGRWTLENLRSERRKLQSELRMYDAESELVQVKIELASRTIELTAKQIDILNKRLEVLRRGEAQEQLTLATDFVQQFADSPVLAQIAIGVQEMAERRISYADDFGIAVDELKAREAELVALEDESERLRERVENIGTTTTIGLALRKQRSQMPSRSDLRYEVRLRQASIRAAELELYEIGDLRSSLSTPASRTKELSATTGQEPVDIERLLELERQVTSGLHSDIDDYFNQLVDLNSASQQLLREIEEFSQFIDQNILWIRSNEPIWRTDPRNWGIGLGVLGDRRSWRQTWEEMLDHAGNNIWLLFFSVILIGVLFWEQRRMKTEIQRLGDLAQPVTSFRFSLTLQSALLTVFLAMVWPVAFVGIGWLAIRGESSLYSVAIGRASITTACMAFVFDFFRQACRNQGLGIVHFRWPRRVTTLIRSIMRWAIMLILPLVFCHSICRSLDDEAVRDTWQRVLFIANQLVIVAVSFLLFRPQGGVFEEHFEKHPEGWIKRLRYVYLITLMGVPAVLVTLASLGFLYTAEELSEKLQLSVLLLTTSIVVSGLLTRWVLVNRRRLRLHQMRERLAQTDVELGGLVPEAGTDVDLKSINEQSKRLIRSILVVGGMFALYGIWARVLPAIDVLDTVKLWKVADAGGNGESEWLTAKSLLLLCPLLFAIWATARNAPGLLEIAILQRLPLDSSIRYAISTLIRYAIVMVGVVLVFRTLGLQWSSVQFVVASLGVGLGFGLQEIFANFISGIILLFERPIRIGDVVTMGDVTGVVTKIHIRATTITNWDRQDFVIPNKDLVTGRVLNWTLTDTANRITLNVGVSYDANVAEVRATLLSILHEHAQILTDPSPMVTLESFDDSSLRFVIRAHIARLDDRLSTIHTLHEMIFDRFRSEGIEIAFPQLDLHVRAPASQTTKQFS